MPFYYTTPISLCQEVFCNFFVTLDKIVICVTNIQNRNIYNFYTLPFAASNFNFLTAARTRTSLTLPLNAAAALQIYIYFYSDNLRYASQTWALHFSKRALVERENVQRPARFGGINSLTN